jgi:hypothetical protein
MTSLYRQILLKAWQITKKFPYLWLLGLLAALLGNGGEYQVLISQTSNVANQPEVLNVWKQSLLTLLPKFNLTTSKVLVLFFTAIITIAIAMVFLWLIISALGGLIKGVALARNNEKSTLKKLLATGSKKFWPVFGLNVIAKIIVYGFLIFVLVPLMLATFSQQKNSLNLLIIAISFLIFIPLSIIVSLATKYASAYVMLDGQKMWQSFKNGWRLFNANWLISLEMAFILFVINILVSFLYIIASILIFSPFFFFGIMNTIKAPELFNILIYISITILLIFSAFIGAWLATFQISSWVLLYLRLTEGGKAYSKIVRWAAILPDMLKRKKE